MSSSTTNEADSVKALLDQLRNSDAWQHLQQSAAVSTGAASNHGAGSSSTRQSSPANPLPAFEPPKSRPTVSSEHVSALLSRLQATPAAVTTTPETALLGTPRYGVLASTSHDRTSPSPLELRNMTFGQALPHLSVLGEDERVIKALEKIRKDQHEFERKVVEERGDILRQQHEKVDKERKMMKLTGTGINQLSAESMNRKFEQELNSFDMRALRQWEGLVAKQQTTLEDLGVPTMFQTSLQSDRDRQQRVIQVLEGIMTGDE